MHDFVSGLRSLAQSLPFLFNHAGTNSILCSIVESSGGLASGTGIFDVTCAPTVASTYTVVITIGGVAVPAASTIDIAPGTCTIKCSNGLTFCFFFGRVVDDLKRKLCRRDYNAKHAQTSECKNCTHGDAETHS